MNDKSKEVGEDGFPEYNYPREITGKNASVFKLVKLPPADNDKVKRTLAIYGYPEGLRFSRNVVTRGYGEKDYVYRLTGDLPQTLVEENPEFFEEIDLEQERKDIHKEQRRKKYLELKEEFGDE